MRGENKLGILSGFTLKMLACVFMACDHVGVRLFPGEEILVSIGRLAFPIFCFFIAEGCHYTKNKLKRFLIIFLMGEAFTLVYYLYTGTVYVTVFTTFAYSILLIYLMDFLKKWAFSDRKRYKVIISSLIFLAVVVTTYFVTSNSIISYGFFGVMLPVFVALFDFGELDAGALCRLDCFFVRVIMLFIGTLLLAIYGGEPLRQYYSLLAIPIVALYNGKIGFKKMKYFFYVFFPLHLVIIEAVALLLSK